MPDGLTAKPGIETFYSQSNTSASLVLTWTRPFSHGLYFSGWLFLLNYCGLYECDQDAAHDRFHIRCLAPPPRKGGHNQHSQSTTSIAKTANAVSCPRFHRAKVIATAQLTHSLTQQLRGDEAAPALRVRFRLWTVSAFSALRSMHGGQL